MLTTTLTLTNRARGLVRDTQAVHRTLLHATGGQRPLWGMPTSHHLVIRHQEPVDWAASLKSIVRQAVTTPTDTPITGAHIRWAMIANPTIARSQGIGDRGKRQPLPPEGWCAWADRKLGDAINMHTIDSTRLTTSIGKRHQQKVTHQRVLFEGVGTVRNSDTLAALMAEGVGPGKAYGCGLLLVEEA